MKAASNCHVIRFPILMISVLVMLFCLYCHPNPVQHEQSLDSFVASLEKRIPDLMAKYGIPGVSLAIVRDGRPAWSGAYGYADLEQKDKMTLDAICRVESISKSVTAWGVLNLVEKGVLQLDAPVTQYLESWTLPESKYSEQDITIRRLLSNTAGMPLGTIGEKSEYDPRGRVPALRDYLKNEAQLVREPGSGFLYSNVGFNLLELIVEEVADRDFAAYMADEILKPLGMQHSSFAWNADIHPFIPTGYELDGEPVAPYVYSGAASGGLFATVDDIARFVAAGMPGHFSADSVLTEAAIRRLYAPEVEIPGLFGFVADAYGLGHFIETLPDGQKAVWHGGQGHGWMTHFHSVPETGDGIVILTNSQRSWPFMAQVLSDWATWSGLKAVNMGRITHATSAFKVVFGFILLVSLWLLYRLAAGLYRGKRTFAPFSESRPITRLFQALTGFLMMGLLLWSIAQPYLFVSSIFPNLVGLAGFSVLGLAIILVVTSLWTETTP